MNHRRSVILICLITLIAAVAPFTMKAQSAPYKFDFGAAIGMSGYLGEANNASLLKHPGFEGELSFRYLPDARWAVRGVLSTLSLNGNTADMENALPAGASYDFSSQVYDLGARVEFNFFSYGIGETYKRLRRWSPYLTLGIGVCMASCDGSIAAAPTLPMGMGVKYKISERLNLGVEFTMTKAFSDKIDGSQLVDLNTIKTSFYKNTDWFSRLTVGVTYEFGKRCETCHYVD